jgi:hemolysin III
MASTHPIGLARSVNRAILAATLAFGAGAAGSLVWISPWGPDEPRFIACLVYGASLVACSLFSFLYNTLERARRRHLLRLCDHACIFLLIAGTYTPFNVIALKDGMGETLLTTVWSLALVGIVLKFVANEAWDRAFVAVYIGLGWLAVVDFNGFVSSLAPEALALLAAGGIAYTVGAIIYARDVGHWTDPVWHALVLVGCAAHFFAVVALI